MPNTPNFVNGKLGTISINANLFNAEQYDFTESTTLDDITYSQPGGATYKILLNGYNWAVGTITFVYDTANQPTIAPFDMIPGLTMSLILYPEGTKPYSFSAFSGSFRFASGPKAGTVRCTVNFESTNTITHPTS